MEVRDYYREILPFYDLELADRGDGELWAWAASAPPGCRVLELGAGTGRATVSLTRTAGQVTALELAPEMIAVAHRKLAGRSNVWLVAADVRWSPLRPRFDLVAAID
ncbi:MAG TPA: class I SAM-dependent methyltransferase, partial [Thermoanaerobaculia bacterium]